MAIRHIRLLGPGATGTRVSAPLLRDILEVLIEGSQRALRVRTQGRSTARGSVPSWITAASEFSVELKEGSTVLEIECPSLREAAPTEFEQGHLFPEVDPQCPAIDFLIESIEAAVEGDERSNLYDAQLLRFLEKLDEVFEHGVSSLEFQRPQVRLTGGPFRMTSASIQRFREVEAKIPRAQRINVAGKLDTIRHSDRTFTLHVREDRIRGVAELGDLQALWGTKVFVSGTAHFTAQAQIQRIEADTIRLATEKELGLFQETPTPLAGQTSQGRLSRTQGPRSGINALFGKWPGDETDDQISEALGQIS